MGSEDTTTTDAAQAAPVAAEPQEDERPRTLNMSACEVCARNMIDGVCAHCGFDLVHAEEQAKAREKAAA